MSFWKLYYRKGCKAAVVDGLCEDSDIATCFADNFKDIYKPNSVLCNEKWKASFLSKFDAFENKHISDECFSVEKIAEHVKMLKRGKAAGVDTLTAEHITFASPVLYNLLQLLFKLMLKYECVPDDFGCGIIIPLEKNTEGDATSSENYRGITLSPVLSKLLESLIMESCNTLLHSDALQFGFKENSSFTNAMYIVCTVVEYYCYNDCTVNTCALDISKAFDRVDQYALLNLMIDRGIQKCIISLMLDWF